MLLFLRYLSFCPDLFVHVGKELDDNSISIFLTPSTGKLIITTHVLPNITRSKGNETITFGQLIEA